MSDKDLFPETPEQNQEHNPDLMEKEDQSELTDAPKPHQPTLFFGEAGAKPRPIARPLEAGGIPALGSFELRGHAINPIIDASMPLINLFVRLQSSEVFDGVEALHRRVFEEIQRVEIEMTQAGYERAVVLAHRYCLCTFIDEGVMSTPWGVETFWDAQSMLSEFHNERWGGEKFYVVLDRLRKEPERYRHMLEFLYLCMSLGYSGRYRIETNGRDKFERILDDLYAQLERLRGEVPETLTEPMKNVRPKKSSYNTSFPYWGIFLIAFLVAATIFGVFRYTLEQPTAQVIEELRALSEGRDDAAN